MALRSGRIGAGLPRDKAHWVKILSIACGATLLLSLLCSVWYQYASGHTATVNLENVSMIQLEEPKAGDPMATVHTTAGDLRFRLFPEQCPNAVANFTQLAEDGYYNNTYVFRVEPDVFFSAGSPDATGTLSKEALALPQEQVAREISPNLWPLRGALCALTTQTDKNFFRTLAGTQIHRNGSRFLVANSISMTDAEKESLLAGEEKNIVAQTFAEKGGIPNFSQQITVFGQLYEGYDVLDKITGAAVTGEERQMRPTEDILLTSIEIGEFS